MLNWIASNFFVHGSAFGNAFDLGKNILLMYTINGMEKCIFVGFCLLKAIGE